MHQDLLTPEFLFSRRAPGLDDDGLAKAVTDQADGLERALTAFQGSLRTLAADVTRTAIGKRSVRDESAGQVRAHLKALTDGEQITNLRSAIQRNDAELLSPAARHAIPSNVNADDWRAAEGETRVLLRKMLESDTGGSLQVQGIYLDAARAGDHQTMRAVELAPTAFPIVDAATLEEGARLFAEHTQPAKFAQLEQQRIALDMLNGNISHAARVLEELAGMRMNDPVAAAAAPAA